MTASKLQTWFPWVQSPVICNAPMLGAVSVLLAVEVIKAGGIGKDKRSILPIPDTSAWLRLLSLL